MELFIQVCVIGFAVSFSFSMFFYICAAFLEDARPFKAAVVFTGFALGFYIVGMTYV